MRYAAFGLIWELPFACPEMGEPWPHKETSVDVTVSLGKVPHSLNGSIEAGPFQQIMPDAALFRFPEVASYLVQCGQKIIITPQNDVNESQIRLFLLGTAASLLLHQRGILPLHASGIHTPKGAVLFTGHSGAGKSTLLATFLERGYAMLTDDLAAVSLDETDQPQVFPGYPHLKLWADSAKKLNKPTNELKRIRPEFDKFSIPLATTLESRPLPLYTVYLLSPSNMADIRLEPLQASNKFNAFLDHTWQKLALKRMNRLVNHFHQAATIANQVHVRRVFRPETPFLPHALADLIEQDFLK